jgi:periplasmic protein TonB
MPDFGSLSHCLVDSDAEAAGRARRLRRQALVISLALEAALVAAMLLWPLITPGVLPRQFIVTPAPPFHGGGKAAASHPHEAPHPPRPGVYQPPRVCIICPPPIIPRHPPSADANEPPPLANDDGAGGPSGPGLGPGLGNGPGYGSPIPGAGDGHPIVPPPPRPAPSRSLPLSGGVMEAALTHRVQPVYPPIAIAAHISGIVQLRAIIAKDGSVRDLEVLSGNPLFVPAPVAAVRQWRYRPTMLSGVPVEVETRITVNFVLE